tara:strand:- start:117 stop:395 length:279 start_codon:yes stop_codon:yes gene_type:complete
MALLKQNFQFRILGEQTTLPETTTKFSVINGADQKIRIVYGQVGEEETLTHKIVLANGQSFSLEASDGNILDKVTIEADGEEPIFIAYVVYE